MRLGEAKTTHFCTPALVYTPLFSFYIWETGHSNDILLQSFSFIRYRTFAELMNITHRLVGCLANHYSTLVGFTKSKLQLKYVNSERGLV